MSFKKCIDGGVTNGVITKEQADEVKGVYDATLAHYSKQMDLFEAQGKAADDATKAMTIAINERKRLRVKSIQNQVQIKKRLNEYGDDMFSAAENFFVFNVKEKYQNVDQLRDVVRGQAMSYMDDVLKTFRRDFIGRTRDKAGQKDMLDAAFGKTPKNNSAKEFAEAWAKVTEYLRLRANAAGAQIPFLENWGLPMRHNSVAVRHADYIQWRNDILPLLDLDKMIDRKTQIPFKKLSTFDADGNVVIDTSLNLEAALRDVFESIATEGANKTKKGAYRGSGALGKKYNHHRFLVFKDAENWMEYNNKYGVGEPFDIMVSHIDNMSRDIALMETFGPNPNTGVSFLEDMIDEHAAKISIGKTPKEQRSIERRRSIARNNITTYYDWVTDKVNTPGDTTLAYTLEGLRNIIHSSFLGSTSVLAVPTDANFGRIARQFIGMPQTNIISEYAKALSPLDGAERTKLAIRTGMVADTWLTVAAGQARYVGELNGPEWTRRIASGVMNASLLSPWTQAGRVAFHLEFSGFLADNAGKAFDQLDPKLRSMMEGYDIGADKWDIIRNSPMEEYRGVNFVSSRLIEDNDAVDPALRRRVATDLLRMMQSETEFAVPSSSTKAKAFLRGRAAPGTWQGEMAQSAAMYKNFGVTLFHTHLARGATQNGMKNKAAYLGAFLVTSTLAASLAIQAKEIAKGRDPLDMTDPRFWGQAILASGGLSIYGDFVFSQDPTGRSSFATTLAGPVAGFIEDTIDLTVGNAYQAINGKDPRFGNDLTKYVQRYMPGSSLWYARTALERNIFDQIRLWVDPKSRKDMNNFRKKRARDYGQKYWWDQGTTSPSRMPDLGKMFGN